MEVIMVINVIILTSQLLYFTFILGPTDPPSHLFSKDSAHQVTKRTKICSY